MKKNKKIILLVTLLTMCVSSVEGNTEYIHDGGGYGYVSSCCCPNLTPVLVLGVLVAVAAAAIIAQNSSTHGGHAHD